MRIKMLLALFILVATIVESTLVSLPLTLIIISALSIFMGSQAAVLAFMAGIVLDLFLLRLVGMDSLFFLLVVLVASRYQKKMSIGNIFYPGFYIAIVSLIYGFVFFQKVDFWQILFAITFGIILIFIFSRFLPTVIDNRKRLML